MIDLVKIIDEKDTLPVIYSDATYTRRKKTEPISPDICVNLLIDTLNLRKVSIISFVINTPNDAYIEFTLPESRTVSAPDGFLQAPLKDRYLFWFPAVPMMRTYKNLLIEKETPSFYSIDAGTIKIHVSAEKDANLELAIVCFEQENERYQDEICHRNARETQRLKFCHFFDTKGKNPFWRYYIHGNIYTERYEHGAYLAWPSEQNANLLYQYFQYLHLKTNKNIYACLSIFIAYSALLRLSCDGRWKHGMWTDLPETHLRFQIDGVDLLMSFYKKTKNDFFLETAKSALNSAIQIADHLDNDMTWFLHDTLETSERFRKLYYKKIIRSNFLKKSISNTLCLNTHLQMLILLKKNKAILSDCKQDYQKGLNALLAVMSANNGTFLYTLVYGLRDCLLQKTLTAKIVFYRNLYVNYSLFIKNHLLFFLKKRFPRLVMPNGYIERDLCASQLLDIYHIITLRDFLFLSFVEPHERLLRLIKHSIDYTDKSGMGTYFSLKDSRANLFLDILWGYSCNVDDDYVRIFVKYLLDFHDRNITLSADIFINPFLSDPSRQLQTTHDALLVFTAPANSLFLDLIVNPTEQPISFEISKSDPTLIQNLSLMDPENHIIAADGKITLKAKGYLKTLPGKTIFSC